MHYICTYQLTFSKTHAAMLGQIHLSFCVAPKRPASKAFLRSSWTAEPDHYPRTHGRLFKFQALCIRARQVPLCAPLPSNAGNQFSTLSTRVKCPPSAAWSGWIQCRGVQSNLIFGSFVESGYCHRRGRLVQPFKASPILRVGGSVIHSTIFKHTNIDMI